VIDFFSSGLEKLPHEFAACQDFVSCLAKNEFWDHHGRVAIVNHDIHIFVDSCSGFHLPVSKKSINVPSLLLHHNSERTSD
jgi:hypothetical protein